MFRSFIAALAAIFVLSGCASILSNKQEDFSQLRTATVKVEFKDGVCSGVIVAPLHVLTAAHCAGEDMKVSGMPALIIKKNEKADLMLLLAPVLGPGLDVATERPAVDTKVYQMGFPLGLGEVLTEGRIQELLITQYPNHMLVSSLGVFGNSGGPVVVRTDEGYVLVGISSMVALVGFGSPVTHLQLVVNTEAIAEFLKNEPISRR